MTASTAVQAPPCPKWCVSTHDDGYDVNYREHHTKPVNGPKGLYVKVTQQEPLNPRAAFFAKGPQVYFAVQPGDGVLLSARQANALAFTLSRLGERDAARLLGDAVTLITGGTA